MKDSTFSGFGWSSLRRRFLSVPILEKYLYVSGSGSRCVGLDPTGKSSCIHSSRFRKFAGEVNCVLDGGMSRFCSRHVVHVADS